MKGIALTPILIMLSACQCCTNMGEATFYQSSYKPTVVASPAISTYDPVSIVDDGPIDVTTTTIDYY